MSILVLGAGELGTAVIEALVRHPKRAGAPIAVVLRQETIDSQDPAKKANVDYIRSLGVGVEAGDFIHDAPGLVPVFKKYATVIQAAGYGMAPGTQLGVTKAALAAGVPWYFPWQFGCDYAAIGAGSSQPLFDEMLEVRALLRAQQATAWTIISNGLFMSYLFLADFGIVDVPNATVRALGGWDRRVTLTTPQDIGVMVAEAAFVPEGTVNEVVYIGGDTVSYGQVADLVEEGFGKKFTREEWNMEFLQARLRQEPENLWYKYQNIFGNGRGIAWDFAKTLNSQRGIPLTGVKKYIAENKESLSA